MIEDRRHLHGDRAARRGSPGAAASVSSETRVARVSSGSVTRTRCAPTGSSSRSGPFMHIGLVRFTRWTVIDAAWRQTATSIRPGPVTETGPASRDAQRTAPAMRAP